ncbi:MAG: DNA relaxase [Sphingobium sp.]|nr:DNA relaxase [Sphingobium sp.]
MIHPRRLTGSAGNIAKYYTVGDYYTKGADEHSEWGGRVAAELGLEGSVDPAIFKELLAGHVAGQTLGRHRSDGSIEHHPGWDFSVNAPKSVSIMALVAQDQRIVAAHEKAVGKAISWLEEHAAFRRRSQGEIIQETTGRLLVARFTENGSRELDPHLHTHVVVMNITNREDGASMTSLESRAMFAEQMVAGQIYRNALAWSLRGIGYDIDADPRRGLFEIRGVPQQLIETWSKRAEQINAHAAEHGLSGQAARTASFYKTRGPKEKISADGLQDRWAAEAGSKLQILQALKEGADRTLSDDRSGDLSVGRRAALFGIRNLETREAVNNQGQILRAGLAAHVGEVTLGDVRPYVQQHEDREKLLVTRAQTGDGVLTRGRTSRRTARLEIALSKHLAIALDDARPLASSDRLLDVLETAGLKPSQEQVLAELAASRDRVIGVHGVAGSGKSTIVKAMAAAVDRQVRLHALAPTSSAAAELGAKANIRSRTVASLIVSGGRGLDTRDVLVVDEAGQLGNRQTLRLLEISRDTGARLVLLGDNQQTGAIEQGKAFWLLQKLGLPKAELTESIRQQTRSMRQAVAQTRAGDYVGAIEHLDKVVTGDGAEGLARQLVDEWVRLKPENRATTNILVLDNATRIVVNEQIREALKREGAVAAEDTRLQILTPAAQSSEERRMARFYSGGQVVMFSRDDARLGLARQSEYRVLGLGREASGRQIVRLVDERGRIIRWDPRLTRAVQINVFNGEERGVAVGDRIQWRLATKALDLKNAERGTVERIDGPIATIRWDRTKTQQEIDLSRYKTWDHGYAETVYSSQSKTYARAYILAPVGSPLVNGQNFYTAITRAQYGVKLWTEDAKQLSEKLSRNSGEKTSALEGLGRIEASALDLRIQKDGTRIEEVRRLFDRARRDSTMSRTGSEAPGRLSGTAMRATETLARLAKTIFENRNVKDRDRDDRTVSETGRSDRGQDR